MSTDAPGTVVDVARAAEILGVQSEQVEAMVAEGLLTPLGDREGTVFDAAEVAAAKNIGG